MKKRILIGLVVAALLVVAVPTALAWQEGPTTDWWYIDPSYGGAHYSVPLVIEIDGNPAAGQTFYVGDTITISGDLYAYAASCAGGGNGAYTKWQLNVAGPSGDDSTSGWDYDNSSGCAESEIVATPTIASYALTTTGTHTVYMSSYAAVAQYWADVADEFVEAQLTFDVAVPVGIDIKPGSDPNCFNNNGHGVIPVAILGSETFDVTSIDAGSVALEGLAVRAVGKSNKLLAHYEDVNSDGFLDLVVQIEDGDGTWTAGTSLASVNGYLLDGTLIFGQDYVCITQ